MVTALFCVWINSNVVYILFSLEKYFAPVFRLVEKYLEFILIKI